MQHAKELVEKDNMENRPNTLIGVVGASLSSVTLPLSVATLAMNLPLVSYASTNRKLSKHKVGNRKSCLLTIVFVMVIMMK